MCKRDANVQILNNTVTNVSFVPDIDGDIKVAHMENIQFAAIVSNPCLFQTNRDIRRSLNVFLDLTTAAMI